MALPCCRKTSVIKIRVTIFVSIVGVYSDHKTRVSDMKTHVKIVTTATSQCLRKIAIF